MNTYIEFLGNINIHIIPSDDLDEHDCDIECHCYPTPEYSQDVTIWTHHAFDGREDIEELFEKVVEELDLGGWEIWVEER